MITSFLLIDGFLYKDKYFSYKLYILFSVLGFYAMPSYLYVFFIQILIISTFIIFFNKKYKILYNFFIYWFTIGALTTLIYLPVFIRSGLNSIINNSFTKRENIFDIIFILFSKYRMINNYLFGIRADYIIILLVLIIILLFFFSKTHYYKLFSLVILFYVISPIYIILIHRAIPFQRTFSFLLIPIFLSMGIVITYFTVFLNEKFKIYINKTNILYYKYLISLFLYIAIPFCGIYIIQAKHSAYILERDATAKKISKILIQNKFDNICFMGKTSYELQIFTFYSIVNNVHLKNIKSSTDIIGVPKADIPILNGNEIIVIDRNSNSKFYNNYKLIFSDNFVAILAPKTYRNIMLF